MRSEPVEQGGERPVGDRLPDRQLVQLHPLDETVQVVDQRDLGGCPPGGEAGRGEAGVPRHRAPRSEGSLPVLVSCPFDGIAGTA